MANQVQSGLATGSEGLVCFVCDVGVVGRYYALATCRTQTTKVRLIEKLGQLVGDDYMVVISEDDVICRGCATMINSLDRLEKEVGSLRSIVLRYLEKKYDMEDGELVNARANVQCHNKPVNKETKTSSSPTDFQSRKRKAMSSEENDDAGRENSGGKDNVWLQCDRCKYTTHYNSYMIHHVRSQHRGDKQAATTTHSTPNTGVATATATTTVEPAEPPGVDKQNGEEKPTILHIQPLNVSEELIVPDIGSPVDIKKDLSTISEEGSSTAAETVEMIAAEIGQDFERRGGSATPEEGNDPPANSEDSSSTSTALVATTTSAATAPKQVTLQAVEGEDGNNTICMVDENGMIVQKVEQAEDGTLYVQMATDSADPTKQVLSVAEDGSVQMVEVLWDDMVNSEETESHSMVTF